MYGMKCGRTPLKLLWILGMGGLGVAAFYFGSRAALRYGPTLLGRKDKNAPAIFHVQATALICSKFGYPKPVDLVIQEPRKFTSAKAQLRLMRWWENKTWLPEALAAGTPDKSGLHLHAGQIELVDILEIGPIREENGTSRCEAKYRIQWKFPDALQEIYRVRAIVGIHIPKEQPVQSPGQSRILQCTFVAQGLEWTIEDAETSRKRKGR
jgi:hypothetical protein